MVGWWQKTCLQTPAAHYPISCQLNEPQVIDNANLMLQYLQTKEYCLNKIYNNMLLVVLVLGCPLDQSEVTALKKKTKDKVTDLINSHLELST